MGTRHGDTALEKAVKGSGRQGTSPGAKSACGAAVSGTYAKPQAEPREAVGTRCAQTTRERTSRRARSKITGRTTPAGTNTRAQPAEGVMATAQDCPEAQWLVTPVSREASLWRVQGTEAWREAQEHMGDASRAPSSSLSPHRWASLTYSAGVRRRQERRVGRRA